MAGGTFTCPQCKDTYQPFWREAGSGICRSCVSDRNCFLGLPHESPHDGPCKSPGENPGDPCRWCGLPTPADGSGCPDCWTSLEGLPLADIKALFAGDDVLSLGGLGSPDDPAR
jgi:hypothetical protein